MYGTSLQGYVDVTYQKLVETFGKETLGYSGDSKCSAQWNLLAEDGTKITIYDYKTNKKYCGRKYGISKQDNTDWHIGGDDHNALVLIQKELGLV